MLMWNFCVAWTKGGGRLRSTGRSGRQKAATRRSTRREERVTVQGPVQKLQTDGVSHRGLTQRLKAVETCVDRIDRRCNRRRRL